MGLEYWKVKARKRAETSFGPGQLASHAVQILEVLNKDPSGKVEGTPAEIARRFDIPLKFTMRALASTIGVVRMEAASKGRLRVVLQRKKLSKPKASAGLPRRAPSRALRAGLLAAENNTCSRCRHRKKPSNLALDYIIPLSMLGADEPGNWVALCKACNREKWQHLNQGFLHLYRGEAIKGRIGTSFRDSRLWRVINRKARYETR